MSKTGGKIKSVKKRFFTLSDNALTYYESQSRSTPKGCIVLTPYCDLELDGKKAFLLKTGKRDYKCMCSTEQELEEWVQAISNVLKKIGANVSAPVLTSTTNNAPAKSGKTVFGTPLGVIMQNQREGGINLPIPQFLDTVFQFLENEECLKTEGIFRLSGSLGTISDLKAAVDRGQPLAFSSTTDPHAVAGLCKLFLREMPDPLFPFECYEQILQIQLKGGESYYDSIKAVLQKLPSDNKNLVKALFGLVNKVMQNSDVNKMGAANLAIVFGPNVLRSKDQTPFSAIEDSQLVNDFAMVMIQYFEFLTSEL